MERVVLNIFPVDFIYMSASSDNPSKYFSGTWKLWGSGRVPVCVDTSQTEFNTVEKTGGSKFLQKHAHILKRHGGYGTGSNHTGILNEMTNTDFEVLSTEDTGEGDSGNLQPYITCYMWKRTA